MTKLDDLEREANTLLSGYRGQVASLVVFLRGLGAERQLRAYFLTTDFATSSSTALMDIAAVIGGTAHFDTLKKDGNVEGYSRALKTLGTLGVKTDRSGVTVELGPDVGKGWTIRGEGPSAARLLAFVSYLTDSTE